MGVRILVDTNIILDYLLEREPYGEQARTIIKSCQQRIITGCITAHSVTNIFYILRKDFTIKERREILLNICKIFYVEGIDNHKLRNALANDNFADFEDCLQMECAKNFHADYIVSRNLSDFKNSDILCIGPEKLCRMIETGEND